MQPPSDTPLDPALLELFQAEMETHFPVLSQGLLALEQGGAGDIAAMMRAAHSIKGAARIVGIEAAVQVSHDMEDCFTAAREQRITLTSDAVDILLQGLDALQRICSPQAVEENTAAWLGPLRERMAAVRDGRLPAPVTAPTPTASQPRVLLPEDFNDTAAESVRAQLRDALRDGLTGVRIDFAPIKRVSAGALALLAAVARDAGQSEAAPPFVAEGVAGPVAALLRVTGLERTFLPD